jgi:ketosteroid isomerase-like protein
MTSITRKLTTASIPPAAPASAEPKPAETARPSTARAPGRVDGFHSKPETPEAVMKRFYDAFLNRRFDEMEKLYAPDVKFKDLVFQYEDRAGTMKMWRKLIGAEGGQYRFEFDRMEGDVAHGRWVADYQLGNRKVHNELETRMVVRDGKIVEHVDTADWGKWARQALPLGKLGTTAFARGVVTPLLRFFVDKL